MVSEKKYNHYAQKFLQDLLVSHLHLRKLLQEQTDHKPSLCSQKLVDAAQLSVEYFQNQSVPQLMKINGAYLGIIHSPTYDLL